MRRNSIRSRMTSSIIVVAVVPSLLVGLVMAWQSYNTQQQQALDVQHETAQHVSAEVQAFIQGLEKELKVAIFLRRLLTLEREQQQIVLTDLQSYQSAFAELTLLDGQGQEQIRLSRLQVVASDQFGDHSGTDAFMVPKNSGETYYSSVRFDESINEPQMTIAIPLQDVSSGEMSGVLVAEVRFKPVWDLIAGLRQERENENIYLVDDHGQLAAHYDPSEVRKDLSFGPPERDGVQAGLDGSRVVLATAKMQLGQQTFFVVAERSWSEAVLDPTLTTVLVAAVALVVALVLGVVVGSMAIRYTVVPIERLAATARAISAGDLSLRAETTRRDEVGNLAEAFNSMTDQLRDMISGLEQRVAGRTAELEDAGQALAARGQELENVLSDLQQRGLELEEANRRHIEANRELRTAHNQSRLRAARLQASSVVSRVIIQEHDMDKLLPQVTELISRRFGFYHVAVFLISANERTTTLCAANSSGGQRMLAQGYEMEISASNVVGRAIRSGELCIGLDVGEGAVSFDIPELPDTRSEVALPLRTGDTVIGVLDVHSVEPSAFDEEDIVTLSTLADQVAISIENARLMQQSQDALEEAEAVYSQMLMGQWEGLTRKRRFSPGEYIQALAPSPDNVPLIAAEQAMKRGNVVAISGADSSDSETPGVSELAAPIQLQGQTIGVLDLQELEGERHWTQDDVILIQEVADQVGQALEKARLFDESRRRAHREQSTRQITDRIRGRTEVDAMLQTAIRELAQTLRAPRVFVRLVPEILADSDERQTREKTD